MHDDFDGFRMKTVTLQRNARVVSSEWLSKGVILHENINREDISRLRLFAMFQNMS